MILLFCIFTSLISTDNSEVCADYGGVNVFHVCLNFGVVYGVGVCVNVCGVVCVVRFPIGLDILFIAFPFCVN